MSKAYQFPHDEPNPFAEQVGAAPDAANENPYLASSAANEQPIAPTYQQTLQPRVGTLVTFAVSALLGGLAALALAFWFLPLGILTLPIAMIATAMARHDLQAMKFGAMDAAQASSVRTAFGLAIVGGLLSAVSLVIIVALLLRIFEMV